MEKILSPQTIIWLLGIAAASAITVYRIGGVEQDLKAHEAEACTTYVRQDVLVEQMRRVEEKLDRIEMKVDKLDSASKE